MKDGKGKRFVNQAFPDAITTTTIITIADHPLALRPSLPQTMAACQTHISTTCWWYTHQPVVFLASPQYGPVGRGYSPIYIPVNITHIPHHGVKSPWGTVAACPSQLAICAPENTHMFPVHGYQNMHKSEEG